MVWSCYNYFVGTEDEEAWFLWLWELSWLADGFQGNGISGFMSLLKYSWVRYHRIYSLISNEQIYDNWTSFVVSDSLLHVPGKIWPLSLCGDMARELIIMMAGDTYKDGWMTEECFNPFGIQGKSRPRKGQGRRDDPLLAGVIIMTWAAGSRTPRETLDW